MAIIMISRGTFSGGKAVAEGLAERLGYPCVSNEVIFDAAEEFGVPEEQLAAMLQEPPKAWRQKPGRRIAHMNFVKAALLRRVREGNLIYHGYAGHLLLTEVTHVMRVRVIANMDYRVQAAMTKEKLSRQQALNMIAQLDRKALKWTEELYGVHWKDPALYDVVLNLDGMSIAAAVDVVAFMTELPDYKPTPASLETFDNLLLSTLVWAELTKDKLTKSANVEVSAENGVVTVAGKAGSHKIVGVIPVVAGRVDGVKEIINHVGVGTDWMW
jgi:cytidylate kinase